VSTPILEVDQLVTSYGRGPAVLSDVSLTLETGELLGVVGANGAGKSTLLRSVSGGLKPKSGSIRFEGESIRGASTAELARRGIVLLSEGHRTIRPLTVSENMQVAAMAVRPGRVKRRVNDMLPVIHEMFPILKERRNQLAGLLSGGEQQMLSVARAMIQRPRLLLLDEPSLGLAPLMVGRIYASFHSLQEQGVSMVVVEQNSARIAEACSSLIVLRNGRVTAAGTAQDLHGRRLHEAYFG
jgi:branched-chain amino acid transport system ATP-binding protein